MRLKIEKIDFELKRLGWSRSKLAEQMGFSRQRLSYILQHPYIKLRTLDKLAQTIQISTRDLIE